MGATLETLPLRLKHTLDTLVRLRPHLKQCIARNSSTLARSSQYSMFVHVSMRLNCAHFKHVRPHQLYWITCRSLQAHSRRQRAQHQTLHNTCSTHCTDLKQGADTSLQVVAKFPRTDHTKLHLLAHKNIDTHTHTHKYTIKQIHP